MCTAGPLQEDTTKQPWEPGVTFAAGRATNCMALPSWSASQTNGGPTRSSANVSSPAPGGVPRANQSQSSFARRSIILESWGFQPCHVVMRHPTPPSQGGTCKAKWGAGTCTFINKEEPSPLTCRRKLRRKIGTLSPLGRTGLSPFAVVSDI